MAVLALSILLFFFLNLLLGSVAIPAASVWDIIWGGGQDHSIWRNIVLKSRLPQAVTALVAGAGLSVAGLQMQRPGVQRSLRPGYAGFRYAEGFLRH